MVDVTPLSGARQASYEVVGSGDRLLMFPGGPGFPAVIVREDAERFEVYLIDPPGTGESSPPQKREDYSHLGHARFYNEVRRALGLGPVTVHGVSFPAVWFDGSLVRFGGHPNPYYDPFPPAPEFLSRARQDFDPLLYKDGSPPAWADVLGEPFRRP